MLMSPCSAVWRSLKDLAPVGGVTFTGAIAGARDRVASRETLLMPWIRPWSAALVAAWAADSVVAVLPEVVVSLWALPAGGLMVAFTSTWRIS
jgi:hypothetical protein